MTSYAGRITLQGSRATFIEKTATDVRSMVYANKDLSVLQSTLEILDHTWKKFEEQHEKLLCGRDTTILEHDYVKGKVFDTCLIKYQAARAGLVQVIRAQDDTADVLSHSMQVASAQPVSRGHILPKIPLPSFSGETGKWTSFQDMFRSMVINPDEIKPVEKMHYLRAALTGEAEEIISSLPITQDSFVTAWELLTRRYDNQRILIGTQLDRLLTINKIEERSSKALNQLLNSTTEAVNALEALNCPTAHWEMIIVHTTAQKLDDKTREAWEIDIGSTTDFPSWNKLKEFITSRARARECIESNASQCSATMKGPAQPRPPASIKGQPTRKTVSFSVQADVPPPPEVPLSWAEQVYLACSCCEEPHFIVSCSRFRQLTPMQRRQLVIEKYLCFNCLGKHGVHDCKSTKLCRMILPNGKVCNGKHHTMIHLPDKPPTQLESRRQEGPAQLNAAHSPRPGILLATSLAHLSQENGSKKKKVRLLLDPGSELSFVTEDLVNRLRLHTIRSSIPVTGIGETASGSTKGRLTIRLSSLYNDSSITINVHVLHRLTTSLPSFSSQISTWNHLENLQLADPDFLQSRPIDILIGADAYGAIIEPSIIKESAHSPIAQLTMFGWVVLGPTDEAHDSPVSVHHLSTSENEIQELLTRFWKLEEVPIWTERTLSPEEAECENHFCETHQRDSSGRYIVRLPLNAPSSELGDSRNRAQSCLLSLLRRLSRDRILEERYRDFLKEYERLGHMRRIQEDHQGPAQGTAQSHNLAESGTAVGTTLAHDTSVSGGLRVSNGSPLTTSFGQQSYFFPHHGVLRESSETTKLRVVFNGSARTSSGRSLNDIMHTGEKLQRDISDVLLWSRKHHLIFMTDITQMFRQIRVHQDDWPLQQILWIDSEGEISTYQLTTVTYGTRSAPFLAVRVLNQLVNDEGSNYPLAIEPLTKGRYVDDICGGADNEEQLIAIAQEVKDLCSSGGFPLAKWHSNSPALMNWVAPGDSAKGPKSYEDPLTKILGLSWNSSTDQFIFSSKESPSAIVTKRIMLSEIAQLFDPLGFLSPVIIRAKILLQSLWLEKLGWDDTVSPQTSHKWSQLREELSALEDIVVPRWLGLTEEVRVELHGFSDASQLAMAATVYLKVFSESRVSTQLVCSKTKVAPLKTLTIPRLELTAAVLLTNLMKYAQTQLNLPAVPVFMWTDSAVTLAWISSHPSRWKEYVRNRVSLIQESLPQGQWRFISGKENPADCASRGLSATQLKEHNLWWTGPSWLLEEETFWPSTAYSVDSSINLEEKPGILLTAQAHDPVIWDLIERFSSLSKLMRITAICQRFIARLKQIPCTSLSTLLTAGDIEQARLFWVKVTQTAYFHQELKVLSQGGHLRTAHPLTKLTPFIDHQGILRVGGRLKFSQINTDGKHPAIIPKASYLAQLIIKDSHQRTLHGGTQLTLSHLRGSYWIIGGRAPVRSYILKCVTCARQRGELAQQRMGQLPSARVTKTRPFLNTGVDYAGPMTLLTRRARGSKTYKGWLAVFVCMATSAIHLEVVTDYSTEAFIAAYRRFASRRGIARNLFSDCGTNFQGADKELKRLFLSGSKDAGDLAQLLLKDGTQWSFNPPAAPHFGGKWEAAVKSVKHHLKRTVSETLLTFEELSTLLAQIEAVLNSRPLIPLTDDPDDLSVLTPGHFLIGEPLTSIPEPSLHDVPLSRLSRWQLIQHQLQGFWKRWSTSYLQQQQAISKWHHPAHNIKVGTMVLLTDERLPPSKWPLARVVALKPGSDQLTRVVTIKTATSTFDRPIAKLAILPVDSSEV